MGLAPDMTFAGDGAGLSTPLRRRLAALTPGALRACKDVIRYVHRQHLKPGDRLPPQDVLRVELGCCNHVLTPALRALTDAGAVVRKTRVGTVLAHDRLAEGVPWTVGIMALLAPEVGQHSYFALLLHAVQGHMAKVGWRSRTYYWLDSRRDHLPRFHEFDGVAEDVARREVDGLVLLTMAHQREWAETENAGTPLCHTSFWDAAPCGVVVDQSDMALRAVAALVERGCRRLVLVGLPLHQSNACRAATGFAAGLRQAGLPRAAGVEIRCEPGIAGGIDAGRQLSALPPGKGPLGLVVLDDYAAAGMAEFLAARMPSADRHYALAVITCRQAPLSYSLPVFRFDVDLEQLAARVIAVMAQRLANPDSLRRMELFRCAQPDAAPGRAMQASYHFT